MTDDPNTNTPDGAGHPYEQMPVEAPRRASLTLRDENLREARVASMAAAHKSLADALRFIYRSLLGVLVVLVAVFLLSGYQQVDQTERALKVAFGAIVQSNLQPGPTLSLPKPLGEIVRVSTSPRTIKLDRAFVPGRFDDSKPLDRQGLGMQQIEPGRDGALLTADQNLAHAVITASYRVDDPAAFLAGVNDSDEVSIVRAIIQQATVRTVATVTIDEILNRGISSGDPAAATAESSLERRIRDLAQTSLDRLDAGLVIDRVTVRNVFAPLRVHNEFVKVSDVDARARRARQQAEEERRRVLNAVAGDAAQPILDLIGDYGLALDTGDDAAAARSQDALARIFAGEFDSDTPIEINGRTYPKLRFSGEAAERLSAAHRNRRALVDDAKSESTVFLAKLEQYRRSPSVFLASEWSRAYRRFLSQQNVQAFFSDDTRIHLNDDPEIARQMQREIQKRRIEDAMDRVEQRRGVNR